MSHKEYLEFLKTLFQVEQEMEEDGLTMLGFATDDLARELLSKLVADERRHQIIVKEIMALVA